MGSAGSRGYASGLPEDRRGLIEGCYTTIRGIHLFGNEEARILKMKANVMTNDGMIYGPVFAVRSNDEGEFESLTPEDLKSLGVREK